MIGLIIKYLIITYVLSDMISFIGELLSNYKPTNKILNLIILFLSYVMVCNKCSSFWISLILSGDLFIASLIAILSIIINKIEEKYIATIL